MRQLLVLLVLVLLMQAGVWFGRPSDGQAFDSLTLATAGFILLGAHAMGELFRRVRLPALLGYLAAGMLFGPKLVALVLGDPGLAPIGEAAIHELGLINVLAVGVIGTMGGGEIKLAELRENFGKLAIICGSVFVIVLPIVFGLVLTLSFVAPAIVPFLAELPLSGRIAGAALFGALAVGMSPAATLALLQEVRAHGRFTSLVLGVVVLGDLILVATFLLILALARLLISPEGLSWARMGEQLPLIAAEFGWALAIGVIVGVVYILYLRFVRREILLFSLLVVFVTSFVCARLHAETLLAFLVAGFVVQNASPHGHTLVEAFERISLPVFVIYFTTQAAALDLVAVTAYLPLTLVLVTVRVGLFVFGVGFGARRAGLDDTTRGHLQLSFLSQGGVDLVLAAMIAEAIPGWGAQVQTVTVATVLFYVIGGPPLLARALDGAGESEAARERGADDLASLDPRAAAAADEPAEAGEHELISPSCEDAKLHQRLLQLHAVVVGVRERLLDQEILARARQRRWVVDRLTGEIDQAFEQLVPEQVHARLAALDDAITTAGREHAHATLAPFDGRTLVRVFRELDAAQPFGEQHRVTRSGVLFEPHGGRLVRALRTLRRVRRAIAGPGQRTVPLGRLWRYHVTLELPVTLWTNTRPAEAELWHMLLDHDRITRRHLTAIADGSWSKLELDEAPPQHGHGHDEHAHTEPPPPSLDEWLAKASEQASQRSRAIHARLTALDAALERGLVHGLARAWTQFLAAVELAGTLELPAWRHRPSSRHDMARAATAELLERSTADRERAAGRFDAMLAVAHAQQVARVLRSAAAEFEQQFAAALDELHADFDDSLTQARALAEPSGDHGTRLAAGLLRMGRHVDLLRRQLSNMAAAEPASLRHILARTPERLAPSREIAADGDASIGDARRVDIRLRAWLSQTLVHEFGVTRASADDELGSGLASLRQALGHIARVIDYHLGPEALARRAAPDDSLGQRITGLLERARTQVDELGRMARAHVDEHVEQSERAGLEPILAHRWNELRRRQRRLDERPRAATSEWLRERQASLIARVRDSWRAAADEFTALLSGRPSSSAMAAWRRALLGPRSAMPEPYQRLFTSVPAETAGLLSERPQLRVLEQHAERWLSGRGGPVLIYGDRGAGKRTLVRQLLAGLGARVDVRWLRLSPELEREADVARELSRWFELPSDDEALEFGVLASRLGAATPGSWRQAEQRIDAVDHVHGNSPPTLDVRNTVIVVENGERLFRRTPAGLARVRAFLDLVTGSSDQLLWIVLMAEPAVRVLDASLELRARFPVQLHVPAMSAAELERVIDMRHQLSGYRLRLDIGRPGLSTWLRSPGAAWASRRRRRSAAFERIVRLSGGNVRQALRLWLVAGHIDARDPSVVIIGPLPTDACKLLDGLPLSSRVLLAALMLHGPLSRDDLGQLYGQQALDLDSELARLAHMGLVMIDDDNPDMPAVVHVETRLIQPLTEELRACNLL